MKVGPPYVSIRSTPELKILVLFLTKTCLFIRMKYCVLNDAIRILLVSCIHWLVWLTLDLVKFIPRLLPMDTGWISLGIFWIYLILVLFAKRR